LSYSHRECGTHDLCRYTLNMGADVCRFGFTPPDEAMDNQTFTKPSV